MPKEDELCFRQVRAMEAFNEDGTRYILVINDWARELRPGEVVTFAPDTYTLLSVNPSDQATLWDRRISIVRGIEKAKQLSALFKETKG